MGFLHHFLKKVPHLTRFTSINTGSRVFTTSFTRSRVRNSCRNATFCSTVGLGLGLGLGFGFTSSTLLANENEAESEKKPSVDYSNRECLINKHVGRIGRLKIFVGYDRREDLAYEVCRYSILKRSSIPVDVIPIKQLELRSNGLYWRERGPTESTEFSFSRFLTPFLAGFDGWAMFVDCDFLYLADIKELVDLIDDKYAIMCVQHDYTPKESTKMDGAVQTTYPRKNWSSMVFYNCGHPKNRILTPELVNSQTGAFLHRFKWLDDGEIGSVPFVWNFLVGHNEVVEDDPGTFPKAIHYTTGGPWFEAWKDCQFAELWVKEMEEYKIHEADLKNNANSANGSPVCERGVKFSTGSVRDDGIKLAIL